jgi:hypothetical protein
MVGKIVIPPTCCWCNFYQSEITELQKVLGNFVPASMTPRTQFVAVPLIDTEQEQKDSNIYLRVYGKSQSGENTKQGRN